MSSSAVASHPSGVQPDFIPGYPPPRQQSPEKKRSISPQKDGGERPVKPGRPGGREGLDLRAEEDAARRMNVGRGAANAVFAGANSRAKKTDLFGPAALKTTLERLAKDRGLFFDEDAMSYLALACESRVRSLLSSAVTASIHRSSNSHLRSAPIQGNKPSQAGKGMWSHRITSDPNALLDALNRQNKDAEQTFRASRMTRLAQETELQRAKDARERTTKDVGVPAVADNADESGPSTPRPTSAGSGGAPVFGAVTERKPYKKSVGKKADLSDQVQHKMMNARAMQAAGLNSKKYAWMNSRPAVPSPLAAGVAGGMAAGSKRKNAEGASSTNPAEGSSPATGAEATTNSDKDEIRRASKRRKGAATPVSAPTTRRVVVGRDPSGNARQVEDMRAVTMMDVLFALERDGMGKGMGSGDEIVRKVWAVGGVHKEPSGTAKR